MKRSAGGRSMRIVGVLVAMFLAMEGCASYPDYKGPGPSGGNTPVPPADWQTVPGGEKEAAAGPVPPPSHSPGGAGVPIARPAPRPPLTAGSVGRPPAPSAGERDAAPRSIGELSAHRGVLLVADDQAPEPELATPAASPDKIGTVEINFENADLTEVIRTLADILDIQYLLDPGVQGTVTIHTAGGMARENLFPLFFKILEVNGLTAVKQGPVFRIMPTGNAPRLPVAFGRDDRTGNQVPPGDRVVIQLIPLQHIAADEMSKLLVPFASEGAIIAAHQGTNTLVVADKHDNMLKILKMASAFDIGLFERLEHRFYLLENAVAGETAATLKEIFDGEGGGRTVRFLPIDRLNAVLVLSADARVFARTDQIMVQLDAPGGGAEPQINVYFVKNGGAEELAALLNAVFGAATGAVRRDTEEDDRYRFSRNPFAARPTTTTAEDKPPTASGIVTTLEATPRRDIAIIPDAVRNALLIESTPADYREITRILKRIDVLPRQVLIEALIAEISLNDRFELGVEWEYTRERESDATGLLSGTIDGNGLSYAVAFSQNLLHNLDALASQNKVNILSSPHVLASDGKEAQIDVANEVPIISSETVITSAAEPLVTTDIQYRDTGVLLAVTPHINENGLVTLEIYQEVSEQGEDVNVAGANYPSFIKRSVDTTLTVGDDQTIVLGGLIRENKSQGRSGVPGLIDIPGLGWLFGSRDRNYDKSELIILLTPRVITSLDHVRAVTEEFERKVAETMLYIQSKTPSPTPYKP